MKQAQKNNIFLWPFLYVAGFALCIIPPAVCTLSYFPLWKNAGYESCIAGGSALLLVICMIPLYRLIKKGFASVSSYLLWLVMFLMFLCLSRIADQMTVISFVGFVGNLLGAVCFRFADRMKGKGHE